MVADCWSVLKAGLRRTTKVARHHRHPVGHARVHARGASPAHPATAPAPGCRDTDAPYRALRSLPGPAPGAPGRSIPAMAAKAAGLLAASSVVGAGAGSGYRAFAGARPAPAVPPQATLGPLSSPSSDVGLGPPLFAAPGVPSPVPVPAPVPGTDSTAVAEPSSALILAAGLVSVVLIRGLKRVGAQRRL